MDKYDVLEKFRLSNKAKEKIEEFERKNQGLSYAHDRSKIYSKVLSEKWIEVRDKILKLEKSNSDGINSAEIEKLESDRDLLRNALEEFEKDAFNQFYNE
ncbi:TPA: hypothetical protein NJU89_001624 [Clostridium perfringens]|uniref:hypothetical protein n=1 Tax=Clostridium perfringens TaxID=1502 RepID=UPI002914B952|nr:hypothetical protein [Clostridium perfringens]EJT5928382.1 hypothetical protein [Clostridium perfringens]EJT6483103.1 hypothetical protein [Clostridium perfringens]MDU6209373.1 hypothetical protein [Clostridium perfringens]BDA23360.1 hypothetical protein CPBEC1_25700 [Clostridium perfringens]